MMTYKYIYNEQGEKEAVIVPIDEWEHLKSMMGRKEKKEDPACQ